MLIDKVPLALPAYEQSLSDHILQLEHSLLKGSFFKSSARDLDLASLKEDTMMVKFPQVKSTAIFLETCPTETHWRGLKRSQGQSG